MFPSIAGAALLLAVMASAAVALSCLDESGSPVDWWAAIKQNDTFSYLYMGPDSRDFQLSPYTLSSPTGGAVSNTLRQLYGASSSASSMLFYNDEPPQASPASSSYAHAKGVFGAEDGMSGFWLVHSTPRWPLGPSSTNQYEGMPEEERTYGQSFLCVTLSGSRSLDQVGEALYIDRPKLYEAQVSSSVGAAARTLEDVAKGEYTTTPQCERIPISSAGGESFSVFAKNRQWGKELYAECVASSIGASKLYVESWIRGKDVGPTCGSHEVLDVGAVAFSKLTWRETQDHSKWAVASSGATGCIGDINRMTSQASRGGGTVCTSAGALANSLLAAVVAFRDQC